MKYQAVLFDKDGTLFEYVEPFERIWQRRLAQRGFHATAEEIINVFVTATKDLVGENREDYRNFEEYRNIWMQICLRALEEMGFEGDSQEAAAAMWYALVVEKSRPHPDTRRTLEALRSKGLKLGLVSNYNITLTEALRGYGLDTFFDAIVPSALVGREKPDGDIFTYALSILGVTPDQALFVGDSYEKDIVGARSVGIDAVLILRNGIDSSYDVPTIVRLSDIVDFL